VPESQRQGPVVAEPGASYGVGQVPPVHDVTTNAASHDGRGGSFGEVGLVHDYLLVLRGAERTFSAISSMWPRAPVYTLLYDSVGTNGRFRTHPVKVSRLRHFHASQKSFRRLLPLFPRAIEHLRLADHDLVISSSSAFAHGVRAAPEAQHVCYCHTPFRYAWHNYAHAVRESSWYARPFIARTLRRIRDWDRAAAQHVTHYIANSQLTRERIEDFWGREAPVVHPPVDVDRFHLAEPDNYFLVVAELVWHKRVEVALEAALRAGQPIKVVGSGPGLKSLRRAYGSTAEFLGRVHEDVLPELYARARALVVPNVEEFGMAAVEAQASGRPVLAASVGGTCETVIDGKTGVLVPPEDVGNLAEAMTQVDFTRFSPEEIRAHAQSFSTAAFSERFAAALAEATGRVPATAQKNAVRG
jgi:glycosyltransferase involved in cell wall biosynthesis